MPSLAAIENASLPPMQPQLHLHGVNTRIRTRQSCVVDMHVPHRKVDRPLRLLKDLCAQRSLGGEIYGISSRGDVALRKQRSTCKLEEWHGAPRAVSEVPLENNGIKPRTIDRRLLKHDINGNA